MLKVIIVDDEFRSRETLKEAITVFCDNVEVVATADTVESAIKVIAKFQPEIVFLDIEMNQENGFELLEKCKPLNFEVIFVTAHEQYALKAIKFSALDYLLKPILVDELKLAVQQTIDKKGIPKDQLTQKVELLLHNARQQVPLKQKIALPNLHGYTFCELDQIIYCEAERNYTFFYLEKGNKICVSKPLKEYEDLLSGSFFRIHSSYMVNLNKISGYIKGEGGFLKMENGAELNVSRSKKAKLLEILSIRSAKG